MWSALPEGVGEQVVLLFERVHYYMISLKSETDLMVCLTIDLLTDIADELGFDSSRDAQEIEHRTASEGVSFLTKRLPALGKALDRALSQPDACMDYHGFKTRGGIPEFLGNLFQRVFDHTGRSLCDVVPSVIGHIRQVLYLWYKYELPYTPAQEEAVENGFLDTEASLPEILPDCPVLRGARDLISRVMAEYNHEAICPKHGPGAVATREKSWEKYRFMRLYRPLDREFPFSEWFIPTLTYLAYKPGYKLSDRANPLEYLESHDEGTARAVLVPKDSRGPRLISCEPLEYQWIQQGVAAEVIRCINASDITSGRINFYDQSVNRCYALLGSMGAGWCTLDMKDASDRVTKKLVEYLFGESHVCADLLASRSHCTVLPSGRQVSLKKFAPMGSALCFPVESLVFFALAVNVLVHHSGLSLTDALERIKVYGDDIICSGEDYAAIMQYFPVVGLRFNEQKCCTHGSFRESCGLDAFSGADVTPVKIRTRLCDQNDAATVASAVQYSNALDFRGYWTAATTLRAWLEKVSRNREIPFVGHENDPVAYLAYRTYDPKAHNLNRLRSRWNGKLHRREVLGICIAGVAVKRYMPGWERLFANIANNPPRFCSPKRNVKVGQTSTTLMRVLRSVAYVVDRTEAVAYVTGQRNVMFPVRRRVTLIRRWCAE